MRLLWHDQLLSSCVGWTKWTTRRLDKDEKKNSILLAHKRQLSSARNEQQFVGNGFCLLRCKSTFSKPLYEGDCTYPPLCLFKINFVYYRCWYQGISPPVNRTDDDWSRSIISHSCFFLLDDFCQKRTFGSLQGTHGLFSGYVWWIVNYIWRTILDVKAWLMLMYLWWQRCPLWMWQ